MPKYHIEIDYKFVAWEKCQFIIEAESLELAKEKAMKESPLSPEDMLSSEIIYETQEYISEKENYVMSQANVLLDDPNWREGIPKENIKTIEIIDHNCEEVYP